MKQQLNEIKRMQQLAGIRSNENMDLKLFKSYIDRGDLKKAAKLYYGTGLLTGEDAEKAWEYVRSKGLEQQFSELDPDPAGGYGLSSHI